MSIPATDTKSEFDSAKSIADTLRPYDKNKQEQILRWVAESMGLSTTTQQQRQLSIPPLDPKPGREVGSAGSPGTANLDIRSFVAEKQPKSDNQFAAVVAYFYRFVAPEPERKNNITAEILQDATRLADRNRFPRPDATLNNATTQGYLDRSGRGEFTINTVGENLVAMTLPGSNGNAKAERRRKKLNKKKSVASK